jgi:non-ribosomal peptide synthetase component F
LTLSIDETASGLVGTLEYATDLFDAVTVEQMTQSYLTILRVVAETPDVHVLEISLLEGEDHTSVQNKREALLAEVEDDFTFERS